MAVKQFLCKVAVDSADTLQVKNFAEIALPCTVSEINALLHFMQNFKMATKTGGEPIFGKNCQITLYTLRVKTFKIKIAIFRTVSKINVFLSFSQKFKMASK